MSSEKKGSKIEWEWDTYGHGYNITIPGSLLSSCASGLVYVTDGNTYIVTTDDGTTVEMDIRGNCIKVNGYKITTETIKNAIKKIQEEENHL